MQTVMEFTHPDGNTIPVLLPARSVLIMTGESRYVWSHSIPARKSDILPLSLVKALHCDDINNETASARKQIDDASILIENLTFQGQC